MHCEGLGVYSLQCTVRGRGVPTTLYCKGQGVYSLHCTVRDMGCTHRTVLRGVGGDVFEGPLDVLVLGQLPCEVAGVHAAQTQQAIVGRQHTAVEQHDLLVLMISPAHTAPAGQYYTNNTSWSVLHKHHLVSTTHTAPSGQDYTHHLVRTTQTPSGQYYTNTSWSVLYKQHQLVSTTHIAPAGQY